MGVLEVVTVASDDFVDVREVHPDYRRAECWNCGHTWLEKRPKTVCHECFMGQDDGHDGEYATDEGYINYGALWYEPGLSRAEMKRRYREKTATVRERMQRRRARKVEVCL